MESPGNYQKSSCVLLTLQSFDEWSTSVFQSPQHNVDDLVEGSTGIKWPILCDHLTLWSFLLPGFLALGHPMGKPEAQKNHHLVPFSQAFQSPYFTDKLSSSVEKSAKAFKCNMCDYSVDRSDSLKRHMRLHTGNMFKCDECGMQYNSKHNLVTHQKKKHGIHQDLIKPSMWL